MIKQTIFIFLLFFSVVSCAQNTLFFSDVVNHRTTYSKLNHNEGGKKIFDLISTTNNLNKNNIYLDIKFQINTRFELINNKLHAKVLVSWFEVNGNINIKDFNIDSLLFPSGFTADLLLKSNNEVILRIDINYNTKDALLELSLSNTNINLKSLKVEYEDIKLHYNYTSYQKIEEVTNNIKYYYSYEQLLSETINKYNRKGAVSDPDNIEIFIHKIELDRISNNLKKHQLTSRLGLDKRDPAGLLKKQKRISRLVKRANTLYNEEITTNTFDDNALYHFCEDFCEISNNYLKKAATIQPSYALAYRELAELNTPSDEKKILSDIINYLSKDEHISNNAVKCILNNNSKITTQYIDEENLADALVIINNSLTVAKWLKYDITQNINNLKASVVAGIAASYLSVAQMSVNTGNNKFADMYLSKAVFTMNQLEEQYTAKQSDSLFNLYFDLLIAISNKYVELNDFGRSQQYLDALNSSNIKLPIVIVHKIDSLNCSMAKKEIVYSNQIITKLLHLEQYPEAYDLIINSNSTLLRKCASHITNDELKMLTSQLLVTYIKQSEILLAASQPEIALELLLQGKELQKYLGNDTIDLNRLIKLSAEPIIENIITKAEYLTWSNELNDANKLFHKADSLNTYYFKGNNDLLNTKLSKLANKMGTRYCLDMINDFNDNITTITILLKEQKYESVISYYNESLNIFKSNAECDININKLIELESNNYLIFSFLKQYEEIKTNLFNERFDETIKLYHKLEKFYAENKLTNEGIKFFELSEFIAIQNNPVLTLECVRYFNGINEPKSALNYLKLYLEEHSLDKTVKPMMREIAIKLAKDDDKQNLPSREALAIYTDNGKKLFYFKTVYLQNRLINTNDD